jgi:hypothetical protein
VAGKLKRDPAVHGGTCVDKVILVNLIVGIREIDIKMKISKKISFLQYIFLFYFNMSFPISGTELKEKESGTKVVRGTKREHFK